MGTTTLGDLAALILDVEKKLLDRLDSIDGRLDRHDHHFKALYKKFAELDGTTSAGFEAVARRLNAANIPPDPGPPPAPKGQRPRLETIKGGKADKPKKPDDDPPRDNPTKRKRKPKKP